MIVEIDFNSDEAYYVQLCNQIILGIATDRIREGEVLPSVRQMADLIGINMHTVNKAYAVLRQEGFVKLDVNKLEALEEMRRELAVVLARGVCKNVSRREVHDLVDELFDRFGGNAE